MHVRTYNKCMCATERTKYFWKYVVDIMSHLKVKACLLTEIESDSNGKPYKLLSVTP